jgi:hypothetical protein
VPRDAGLSAALVLVLTTLRPPPRSASVGGVYDRLKIVAQAERPDRSARTVSDPSMAAVELLEWHVDGCGQPTPQREPTATYWWHLPLMKAGLPAIA